MHPHRDSNPGPVLPSKLRYIISQKLVNTPPRASSFLRHQSQLLQTLDLVGLKLNEGKSELVPVQDIQFLGLQLCLDQGRASLPISKAWEIIACACRISSQIVLSCREVSHFIGSSHWVNYT